MGAHLTVIIFAQSLPIGALAWPSAAEAALVTFVWSSKQEAARPFQATETLFGPITAGFLSIVVLRGATTMREPPDKQVRAWLSFVIKETASPITVSRSLRFLAMPTDKSQGKRKAADNSSTRSSRSAGSFLSTASKAATKTVKKVSSKAATATVNTLQRPFKKRKPAASTAASSRSAAQSARSSLLSNTDNTSCASVALDDSEDEIVEVNEAGEEVEVETTPEEDIGMFHSNI